MHPLHTSTAFLGLPVSHVGIGCLLSGCAAIPRRDLKKTKSWMIFVSNADRDIIFGIRPCIYMYHLVVFTLRRTPISPSRPGEQILTIMVFFRPMYLDRVYGALASGNARAQHPAADNNTPMDVLEYATRTSFSYQFGQSTRKSHVGLTLRS